MKGRFYSYFGVKNKFVKENRKKKNGEEMVISLTQKTNIARALRVWPHACHEPCSDRSDTSFRNNFRVDLQIMKLLKRRNVKCKDINNFRFKLSVLKENATKIKHMSA